MTTETKQTITSLEIAELTNRGHEFVRRDIRNMIRDAELNSALFKDTQLQPNGENVIVYILPRRECEIFISEYSLDDRLAILDYWHPKVVAITISADNLPIPDLATATARGIYLAELKSDMGVLMSEARMCAEYYTHQAEMVSLEESLKEIEPKTRSIKIIRHNLLETKTDSDE